MAPAITALPAVSCPVAERVAPLILPDAVTVFVEARFPPVILPVDEMEPALNKPPTDGALLKEIVCTLLDGGSKTMFEPAMSWYVGGAAAHRAWPRPSELCRKS